MDDTLDDDDDKSKDSQELKYRKKKSAEIKRCAVFIVFGFGFLSLRIT